VGVAALLHRDLGDLGRNVAVVISGGNVDSALLAQVLRGEYRT
jgi:threonine dehydratase